MLLTPWKLAFNQVGLRSPRSGDVCPDWPLYWNSETWPSASRKTEIAGKHCFEAKRRQHPRCSAGREPPSLPHASALRKH